MTTKCEMSVEEVSDGLKLADVENKLALFARVVPMEIRDRLDQGTLGEMQLNDDTVNAIEKTIIVLHRKDTAMVVAIGNCLRVLRKYVENVQKENFEKYVMRKFEINAECRSKYMRTAEIAERVGIKTLAEIIHNPSKIYALMTAIGDDETVRLLKGETISGITLEQCRIVSVPNLRKQLAGINKKAKHKAQQGKSEKRDQQQNVKLTSNVEELPSMTPEQEKSSQERDAHIQVESDLQFITKGVTKLIEAAERLRTSARTSGVDELELTTLRLDLEKLAKSAKQLDEAVADELRLISAAKLKAMHTVPARETTPVATTTIASADNDAWLDA